MDAKLLYDVPDLQDKIRKLRTRQSELQKQKESLTAELEAKEKAFSLLRQELVVAAPNEALRYQADDFGSEDGLDSKRFLLMNEKLEMQLLIHEIHAALPRLEQEAKAAESAARIQTKSATGTVKALSTGGSQALLAKSTAELEQLLEQVMDELMRSKTDQSRILQECKQANQELCSKIAASRRELNRLLQEKLMLQKSCELGGSKPRIDQARLACLLREQRNVRDRLQAYHNGYGWQTEVFRQICGKNEQTISVSKIPAALEDWLCPSSTAGKHWKSAEFIQSLLREIKSDHPSRLPSRTSAQVESAVEGKADTEEDELLILADQLDEAPVIEQPILEIDLSTFCQLCDRLVILLER